MGGDEPGPENCDREPAEAGGRLEPSRLAGEIGEEAEPDRAIGARGGEERIAPPSRRAEREQIGETLDGLGHVGAEQPERVARLLPQSIDPGPACHRREHRVAEEGQQDERERPAESGEDAEHGERHEDRDDRGGDGVGVEILDGLDVLRGERNQIARAAAQQIGGRQPLQHGEEVDPHLREQPVGHVVGERGFRASGRAR